MEKLDWVEREREREREISLTYLSLGKVFSIWDWVFTLEGFILVKEKNINNSQWGRRNRIFVLAINYLERSHGNKDVECSWWNLHFDYALICKCKWIFISRGAAVKVKDVLQGWIKFVHGEKCPADAVILWMVNACTVCTVHTDGTWSGKHYVWTDESCVWVSKVRRLKQVEFVPRKVHSLSLSLSLSVCVCVCVCTLCNMQVVDKWPRR